MLRWEGRGDHRSYSVCPECADWRVEYRCKDCLGGGQLICCACLLKGHAQLPLHRVQKWTGSLFERESLKRLGLRIQLGHWHVPKVAAGDDFVIIDDHGVHEVALDYCDCGARGSRPVQLLRAHLYPSTTTNPRTAATFAVMQRFHLLSFESKISAYEFYKSLARETDNTGLVCIKNRYHEFLRMTREWRHLQMIKRAGRGHDPLGASNTAPGECALLCPACPHPGKNLPPDWKNIPEEKKFLYALFLAMDANFRLKQKDVSTEEKDPGLGPGWAFFCEVKAYMEHLAQNWDQPQERSHCVAHDAVDKPDREARGTASSGIGAVDCARHNMKRPNAVGDLQWGERYINMDYMFFMSIAGSDLIRYFVSYDIACQWHINIWNRMAQYKEGIRIMGGQKFITFLVPKFHRPAHIESCNLRFSFNLTRDVGQTDGEAPEHGWADSNPLASSTKEMGPGARRDALDAHFNDWNHKKIIDFGKPCLMKTENAVPQMVETRLALEDMEESLATGREGESPVGQWTEMAKRWEEDPEAPNPFETVKKDKHLAKVRRELAEEAAAREVAGIEEVGAVRADMHVTELIAMGLQLEEQQRTLGFDVAAVGLHPTDKQRTAMLERTSKLRRKIFAWIDIQILFFPHVTRVRDLEDESRARAAKTQPVPGVKVHEIALWLPSAISGRAGSEDVPCNREVMNFEYRLRVGQAHEALHEIRRQLLVRTHLYKLKDNHTRGVKANTRSQDKIDALNDRIRRAAEQYRAARRALVVLGRVLGEKEWERVLKPLHEDDVRGLPRASFADPERQKGRKGNSKRRKTKKARVVREVSWIWIAQAQEQRPGEPPVMNEALRIEWAKVRARHLRWSEEVDLLEEEMRRIRQFLTWRSTWWAERVDSSGLPDGPQLEGENAYALRQAAFQADLCANFAKKWSKLPELIRKGRAGEVIEAATATAGVQQAGGTTGDDGSGSDDGSEEEEPIAQIPQRAVKPTYVDE
ncbi:hypothetical protein B0H10DRAFT_1883358 [Mycena sp. CBHHK59/15]|nr:hypothetical protein B0H10DRAFT_1883358 [Mycena sp. CBHHK59/15]